MLLSFLKKNWFLLGILSVIFLANWKPDFGKKGGMFSLLLAQSRVLATKAHSLPAVVAHHIHQEREGVSGNHSKKRDVIDKGEVAKRLVQWQLTLAPNRPKA